MLRRTMSDQQCLFGTSPLPLMSTQAVRQCRRKSAVMLHLLTETLPARRMARERGTLSAECGGVAWFDMHTRRILYCPVGGGYQDHARSMSGEQYGDEAGA